MSYGGAVMAETVESLRRENARLRARIVAMEAAVSDSSLAPDLWHMRDTDAATFEDFQAALEMALALAQ